MPRDDLNDLVAFLAVARGAQLHPGRREARGFAVGAQPTFAGWRRGSACGC